jgi:parallel beta-helix repeat protein
VSNVTAAGTTSWDGTAGSTFLDPVSKLVSFAIYLDDFASGIQVYGNVLNHNIGGIDIHSGWNNTVTNNIVANGSSNSLELQAPNWTGAGAQPSSNNVFDHNIVVANSATSGTSEAGGSLTGASWDHNLYSGTQLSGSPFLIWGTTAPNYYNTLAQWQGFGFDLHSVVADPLFANAAQGNFTLAANSPAYALGFQDIPIAQIGLPGYHAVSSYDLFGHTA